MKIGRLFKHLAMPRWRVASAFPKKTRAAIAAAVSEVESLHCGELRIAIEGAMPLSALMRDETPRQRALELFSRLRVWDTEHNNGVLIYLQLADRRIEVLADRGIATRVPQADWDSICRGIEIAFKARDYQRGSVEAVRAAGRLLATHFPAAANQGNELPDAPVLL